MSPVNSIQPRAERRADGDQVRDQGFDFSGPFFDSRTAAAYVCNRSVKAFYDWCRRHGITRRSNGSIAKIDLDRELRRKRQPRVMRAASLANLRKVRRHV